MITFVQSRDIDDYRPLIDSLIPDFGPIFLHTLLQWCGHATDPYENSGKYWELYLVKSESGVIGICGLYSLVPNCTDQLWLGWLGLVPDCRNKGIGKIVMEFLYGCARDCGCVELLSYVDKEGKPLKFYAREGFIVLGTVDEYLRLTGADCIDGDDFECPDDFVIRKDI